MLFRLLGLLGIGTFVAVISAFTVSAGDNEMTEVKKQNINWVFFSDQVMGGVSEVNFLEKEGDGFSFPNR